MFKYQIMSSQHNFDYNQLFSIQVDAAKQQK